MAALRNNPPDPEQPPRDRESESGFSFDRFYQINRRALIWIILGLLLWLLRPFFSLVFLTFVFAFIAAPISAVFERRLRLSRRPAICLTFSIFLIVIASVFAFVAPQVAREAISLKNNLAQTELKLMQLRESLVEKYPAVETLAMNYLRSKIPDAALAEIGTPPRTNGFGPGLAGTNGGNGPLPLNGVVTLVDDTPTTDPTTLELKRSAREDEAVIHLFITYNIQKLTEYLPAMLRMMWAASGTIALALLFSFLISLDISRLGQELGALRASRLRDFHEEAAQPVVRFAYVVGRAIQAQAMIAVVNTTLTLAGMIALGIPSLAMLSVIVFLCSFIPVLGVFISTVPIVLVALNTHGINLAIMVVVMVILVHAVEAYLLNPIIYGKHLKINPVLVLIILFVGHHAFGVWGMLLGVPVAHYFIHDVFGVPVWSERRMAPKHGTHDDPEPEQGKPLTPPDEPIDL